MALRYGQFGLRDWLFFCAAAAVTIAAVSGGFGVGVQRLTLIGLMAAAHLIAVVVTVRIISGPST